MNKAAIKAGEAEGKTVRVFLHSKLVDLTGDWQWDTHSGGLFWSNDNLFISLDFTGTKGIIHSGDLTAVKEKRSFRLGNDSIYFRFRIHTTFSNLIEVPGTYLAKARLPETYPCLQNRPSSIEFKTGVKGKTVQTAGKTSLEKTYKVPVKYEKREVSAVLCLIQDISKKFLLHHHRKKVIWIRDKQNESYPGPGRKYRVLYTNPEGEKFFGSSKDKMLGKMFWNQFQQAVKSSFFEALKSLPEKLEYTG